MTQLFTDEGLCLPCTILEVGPCTVTQVKTLETDGYDALQLGYEPIREKVTKKPQLGHFKKAGVEPHRFMREERLEAPAQSEPGTVVTVEVFGEGERVDVTGTTRGRGHAGVIKRHGFSRRPGSHGHMLQRRPGSIGQHSDPSRVFKGKRMAGQMGNARHTTRNLEVLKVDKDLNLLLVKGAVPGPRGGFVMIRTAKVPRIKGAGQKG